MYPNTHSIEEIDQMLLVRYLFLIYVDKFIVRNYVFCVHILISQNNFISNMCCVCD